MIQLEKPTISRSGQYVYLSSHCKDDVNGIDTDIWYRTKSDWGEYFTDEIADAFVLLALLPAIKTGQNIKVYGGISSDLRYRLDTSLLYLFHHLYNADCQHIISIETDGIIDVPYHGNAVACGCSLGVDSLSAIKRHCDKNIPVPFQLTHLTFFNIGALGEHNLDEANEDFKKELPIIKSFSDRLGLPLVTIESNSCLLFSKDFDFQNTHTLRNACAVLTMQKLFGKYFYASSYPLENAKVSTESIAFMDAFLLPLLSNTNVTFYCADGDKTRIQKTEYIASDSISQDYLYVCWKDIFSNGNPSYRKEMDSIPFRNCTRCDKCLRTALTLDVLGVLNSYSKLFDLEYYYSQKQSYIYQVLSQRGDNPMYAQIASLINTIGYNYPKIVKYKLWAKKLHLLWLWNFLRILVGRSR